ncbi:hypothetical protein [Thaumasiovibrio sp. DFM-14]|uniref:hypothetical protein n=1 Tax=Thaumasiovibrio sp. DFM-14 TaxID=3384792 RepID=UPI0039A3B6BC
MTLNELFTLREMVETRVNRYWAFWSVSIFAVCGWLFSNSATRLDVFSSILIAIGLLVFFIANMSVIFFSTRLSLSIEKEIIVKANDSNALSPEFKQALTGNAIRTRLLLTLVMHAIIDVALLIALVVKGVSAMKTPPVKDVAMAWLEVKGFALLSELAVAFT